MCFNLYMYNHKSKFNDIEKKSKNITCNKQYKLKGNINKDNITSTRKNSFRRGTIVKEEEIKTNFNKKFDIYNKMLKLNEDLHFQNETIDSKKTELYYLLIFIEKEKYQFLSNYNRSIHRMNIEDFNSSSESHILNHKRRTIPQETPVRGKKKTALDYLLEQTEQELHELKRTNVSGKYQFYENEIEPEPFPLEEFYTQRKKARKQKQISDSEDFIHNDIFYKMIVRSGKRIYPCPEHGCTKAFPSLSRVKRHYIVHTGEKPFKCMNKECNKTFSRKDNMIQHFKSHCIATKKK